ncbi:MAG TPA: hypothetical protein PK294_06865 [Ignavibacteria bacterium]|nr:hypothetical protein [Ignavibacteria bacterium]HQY52404.1 hypothetical protein [Ignavibacteria bacterium]HRB00140.1 hypothetical protein [Ignavibacteria bacterium]
MKKLFNIFLFLIFIISGIAGAQTDNSKGDTKKKSKSNDFLNSQTGLNSLMGQFVKGINNSSFSDGKTGKNEVLGMLKGVNTSDYLKYAGIVGSLAGALKGTSFLPDWASNESGVLDQLQNAASIADVAGGLLEMSSMLDPSSFTKSFSKKKSSWSSALNVLSMLK